MPGQHKNIPCITPIGQLSPPMWGRFILLFKLHEDYEPSKLLAILRLAYRAASRHHPELTCQIAIDSTSSQANKLHLKTPDEDVEYVEYQDLRGHERFPMSFSDLEMHGFPLSVFEDSTFCPTPILAVPDQRTMVSLTRASFIEGGLILAWSMHHATFDVDQIMEWAKTWSRECLLLQDNVWESPVLGCINLPEEFGLTEPCAIATNPFEDANHHEFIVLRNPEKQMQHIVSCVQSHQALLIRFSEEGRSCLRKDMGETSSMPSSYIDAITAIVWQTVLKGNVSSGEVHACQNATLLLAFDGRYLVRPKITPSRPGCYVNIIHSELPVDGVLADDGLEKVVQCIRKATYERLDKFDGNYTRYIETFSRKQPDLGLIGLNGFSQAPEATIIQSYLGKLRLCDLDWGTEFNNTIKRIRTPSTGILPSYMGILPTLPNGDIEVIITLPPSCIDFIKKDELLGKYAEVQ